MKNTVDEAALETNIDIPEDSNRLVTIPHNGHCFDIKHILESLKKDYVVLVPEVAVEDVDKLMCEIAESFNLKGSLEVQAAFASSMGLRKNIGKYYMSVNERKDYHIVPPHSEGSTFANMQLASFYCYENTTDGGETILMNVNESSNIWEDLREFVVKGKFDGTPTSAEIATARALYRVDLTKDTLQKDDKIVEEFKINSNLQIYTVLAKLNRAYSCILEQERYAFWDSVCATDYDSLQFMEKFLQDNGLFKEPPCYKSIEQLDWDHTRRIINSGLNYEQLFKCKITRKLKPKDFIIQNNITWAHSVNNWTPGSGVRTVAAAFA